MSFLNTSLKSGYITDLMLPPREHWRGKSAEEIIQLGLSIALDIVHDFDAMIRMNPLVTKLEHLLASDPKAVDVTKMASDFHVPLDAPYATSSFQQGQFAITDKLTVLPGYSTDLVYHSAMRTTTTGMESLTDPGSGVTIYGRWEVKQPESETGVLHLLEMSETRSNVFLSWYIKATTNKSHQILHQGIKERWLKRMKSALTS